MMQKLVQLAMQYIVNLTLGLVGAFFYFIYGVYNLVVAYGEPTLSGVSFFLLVLVAGLATVGSYLFAIYGTVAGGGYYLIKEAKRQAELEGGARRQAPRQVNYGHYGDG